MKTWPVILTFAFTASAGLAQIPYKPTPQQLAEGYEMANTFSKRTAGATFNLRLQPNWYGADQMWFRLEKPDGSFEYEDVSSATGKISPLFNAKDLADALVKAKLPKYDPTKIPIRRLELREAGTQILMDIDGRRVQLDRKSGVVTPTDADFFDQSRRRRRNPAPDAQGSANGIKTSPDKAFSARMTDGNVEIRSGSAPWKAVTTEGNFEFLQWGGDSQHLIAWHCIPGDRKPLYLLHATGENKTRATLETRLYDQPGDKLDTYIPYIIDAKTMTEKPVSTVPMMNGAYPWPAAPDTQWFDGGFLIDYPIRGYQEYKVDFIDPNTAGLRTVVDEKSKTFVDLGTIHLQTIPGTHDILWNSERDGWARLYRIDVQSGKVLNAVTPTDGVFRSVSWLDEKNQQIYYMGNDYPDCVSKGQNPYLQHLYRANLDGTNVADLTPEDGTHIIQFSPDHKYFTDTYEWVNEAPVHNLVRSADGKIMSHLATADISKLLANGVKLPIPFHAKGRDGKTDIWGVICLPTNFNPKFKYPVIENIYAGPQDSFVPIQFYPSLSMSRMAELGFIVVQIDGMGTDNRGRAFHDVCWHNLVDAGFPDRILWMQAAAKKMPQLDLSRVGVYGTSAGGQDAVNAVLHHGDFYKAAVASCGCYDNRIDKQWWNEQWMGYPIGPWYAEQSCDNNVAGLKGHLLLMDAEDDHNVPPESSIRLADALIKAGKDFSYMIFPASDHTDGGVFGELKRRNFFVQWLFGMNPPNVNASSSK